jgi:hypothetical protein
MEEADSEGLRYDWQLRHECSVTSSECCKRLTFTCGKESVLTLFAVKRFVD